MTPPTPLPAVRARLAAARIHLIVTEAACRGHWEDATRRALASGAVGIVQLREKSIDDREFARRAATLRALADAAGALLVLNDRAHLVVETGADGVHVGEHDVPVAQARALVGPDRVVGLSTHDPASLVAAASRGADYVGLGPCYATSTKRLERAPGGPALVDACMGRCALPVFAIGGVTPERAAALADAGASRVAVAAGVLGADDAAAAARAIDAALSRVAHERSDDPAVPAFGTRVPGESWRPRPGAYAVLHDVEGRVGVVRTPKGLYLAGGGIDGSEAPEVALAREVREEVGHGVRVLRTLGRAIQFARTDAGEGVAKRCTFFDAVLTGPSVRPVEADHELVWQPLEAALAQLAHGSQAFALHLLDRRR